MFYLGLFLFLAVHSINIFLPQQREVWSKQYGLKWKAIYSLIAGTGFILMIIGYANVGNIHYVYSDVISWRPIASVLMLFAFILMFAPYFPGKISRFTKHPQMLGIGVWSIAHIPLNGQLHGLILFSSFLTWSLLYLIKNWHKKTSLEVQMPAFKYNDVILILLGVLAYFSFIFALHEALIGIPLF